MNEYSFKNIMARNIDESKLERIKEATLQMVVSKGFGGASISEIARIASVAEGYLYRFYKGKTELVNDLLFTSVKEIADKLEFLLDKQQSIKEIFTQLIRAIFDIANAQPVRIKFLYVLMHDYNFNIQETQLQRISTLCTRIKEVGLKSDEFRPDISEEEIYLMGVVYPIQLINLRFKGYFKRSEIGENEITEVLKICMNSLKK
jgi:TetR/AcrR family transcriptional regulator, repressor of fatR-cypB operon